MLFANKKCQHILSEARKLMKADLYNSVQLQPGDDCSKWISFVARYVPSPLYRMTFVSTPCFIYCISDLIVPVASMIL